MSAMNKLKIRTPCVVVLLLSAPALAWASDMGQEAAASDLDALIAIAREMNPSLAAAALESDAAAARVGGAGSLPDPKFQWQPMDIPRGQSDYLPSQFARTDKFFLQQEFPLWGKRDLKREIAEADSRKAAALRGVVETELVARVKVAYAEYHEIHQAIDLDNEILPRLTTIARVAAARYAQGFGSQQEVTGAEIERTQLATELAALESQRRTLKARLNSLIGRDPQAPIAETPTLRALPGAIDLGNLVDRAHRLNPELRAQESAIASADKSTALAEKGLYPDIAVTFGGVKSYGRFSGYEGMLEVSLPIRGDLHDAEIGEAKAMSGAARSKREAKGQEIENEINEAYWDLQAAKQIEKLVVDSALPQARIGFESAARAYEVGKGDFIMVLTAEQQWRKTHLDHLKAELEQQVRLAEIEKLVGGDL
jgi:outer membrane protein TolC